MLPSIFTTLSAASVALASSVVTVTVTETQCPTSTPSPNQSAPVAIVKNGSYSGVYNSAYDQDFFLGIPYAQPPVNDLRFRIPSSLNSTWSVTRNATAYSPFCVGYGGDDIGHEESEDCLYLNVIRPSTATSTSSLPVAVWIHGGGLYMGGTNDPRYNLSFIVQNSVDMNKPMIGISIQYRLSAWGFLGGMEALEGGATNLGYRDQRLALHWIQENVAAFGGDPSKVTIWGESAGGQSVGAQLLAYNGRDDNLFRAAIAESGGPSLSFFPSTLPGCFNSTVYQTLYNTLVTNTSCAATLSNGTSLSCLRSLPFNELNAALNISTTGLGPFVPVLDNDFIATYPITQLATGNFVRVPLLIGTNTDEGTAFGSGYGPNGTGVNTDSEWLQTLNLTGISPASSTADIISALYPNIQALGIPSLTTDPSIITPNSPVAAEVGAQFRRVAAYFGDIVVIAPRRASSIAWSSYNVPSYAYRFDVTVNGVPPLFGATHFQEVAFMFNNTLGQGYAVDPFGNLTQSESTAFQNLAVQMSRSWVSFVTELDPNMNGVEGANTWPVYNASLGGGAGMNMVFTVNQSSYAEPDTFRGEGIAWISEHAKDIYGR